ESELPSELPLQDVKQSNIRTTAKTSDIFFFKRFFSIQVLISLYRWSRFAEKLRLFFLMFSCRSH
ncbi:MAG: hypothetical protein IIU71_11205, partial [Selenomonadaceae bacterium]|nr:hypothetical protein [Selenomonadaceae bacterium]